MMTHQYKFQMTHQYKLRMTHRYKLLLFNLLHLLILSKSEIKRTPSSTSALFNNVYRNKYLPAKKLHRCEVNLLRDCAIKCMLYTQCKSFNIKANESPMLCDLLPIEKDDNGIKTELQDSEGWTYYDTAFSETKSYRGIANIDGGRWKLVRHVPAGNRWHKATDLLRGSDVYGVPCGATCDKEWSIKFDNINFNQFLFATGDETKWLIASKDEVIGAFYPGQKRLITKSSIHPTKNSYAIWYRRDGNPEDPWISITDHFDASSTGNMLYGGNHRTDHVEKVLPINNGANVFIR